MNMLAFKNWKKKNELQSFNNVSFWFIVHFTSNETVSITVVTVIIISNLFATKDEVNFPKYHVWSNASA